MQERDRHVDLETCFNFRDLGGYLALGGARLRWGAIYRADSLQRITSGDSKILSELGIRTVIDLRSTPEFKSAGLPRHLNHLAFRHVPMVEERLLAYEPGDPDPPPGALYLAIAINRGSSILAALRTIAESEHAVVFHCYAGKDRTGVLAAVLLHLLGVSDRAIVEDYALSDRAVPLTVAWATANAPTLASDLAAVPAWLLKSSPEQMSAFLEGLRGRYGSIWGYLAEIGVDEELVATLRGQLLEM